MKASTWGQDTLAGLAMVLVSLSEDRADVAVRRGLGALAGLGFDRVHLGAMPPGVEVTLDLVTGLLRR